MSKSRRVPKKFEDPSDPERSRAKDFGLKFPVKERGKVEGHCHSFLLTDKDQSINIVEWKDGEITAFIEEYDDDDDD